VHFSRLSWQQIGSHSESGASVYLDILYKIH
jgi:hypothetical protein